MNPQTTVHELDRMLKEIRRYRELRPEYYRAMMAHLNDMSVLSLLEFTSGQPLKKANLESLVDLLRIIRSSKRQM